MSESEESDFWQADRYSSSDQSFKEKDEKSEDLASSNDDQQRSEIIQHKFNTGQDSEENREFVQDTFHFQWETSSRVRSRKHKLDRKRNDATSLLQEAKRFCSEAGLTFGSSNQNSTSSFKQWNGIKAPEVERVTKLRTSLLRLAKETATNFQSVPSSNEQTLDERNVILVDDEECQPNNNAFSPFFNDDLMNCAFYEPTVTEETMDHSIFFRPIGAWDASDLVPRSKESSPNIGTDRYRLLNKQGSNRTNRMPNTGTKYLEKFSHRSEMSVDQGEFPREHSRKFYSGVPSRPRSFQGGYSDGSAVNKQTSKAPFQDYDNESLASLYSEREFSVSPMNQTSQGSPSQDASKRPFRFSTCTMSHDNTKSSQQNEFPYKRQHQRSDDNRPSSRTMNDGVQQRYTSPRTFVSNEFDVNSSRGNNQTISKGFETHYGSSSAEVKLPASSTNWYQGSYDQRHRPTNMMHEANSRYSASKHSRYQSGHANSAFRQRSLSAEQSDSYLQNRGYDTKVKERSKSDLPTVCHKEDFDSNCFWKQVKFNNIDPYGGNQNITETFYVSSTEPVITVVSTRESKSFPHHHIHDPLYKDSYQVGRKLVPCQLPEKIHELRDGFDFTVLSYNVLSDDLLWQNRSLYHGCPEWVLDWRYRKKNLLKEIINYNADVLCLQEVQADHYYQWFLPKLHECGYVGIYKQRTGDKTDGCATFYLRDRFTQRQFRYIEYKMYGNSIMDRDNVGLILALDPIVDDGKSEKPTIFIANTHLLFNKSRGDIKLLQLARLLAEIDEMANMGSNLSRNATAEDVYNPVIICGDFNSMPYSSLYNLVTEGKLKYQGKSRVHISGQHSQHKHASEETFFQSRLIPNDMNISHLCRKKQPRTDFSRDVNETEDSSSDSDDDCVIVCEKICGRKVMMEEPGVLKHLLQLRSAYKHPAENDKQAVTTCHGTVDYIMFSQGVQKCISENLCNDGDIFVEIPRKQLYLTGLLTLLNKDDLYGMNKLPNTYLSSDHLALLASFRLFE